MNRKGQIGSGITAFTVFIFIFVIMALFVAFSAGLLGAIKPKGDIADKIADPQIPYSYNPLFKIINVTINNADRKVRILDLFLLGPDEKLDAESVKTAMNLLVTREQRCFIAAQLFTEPTNPSRVYSKGYFVELSGKNRNVYDGEVREIPFYESQEMHSNVIIKEKITRLMMSYYYGGCQP